MKTIDYKLAKELKDVGFPQDGDSIVSFDEDGNKMKLIHRKEGAELMPFFTYIPTLSELIDACEPSIKGSVVLNITDVKAVATKGGWVETGETPEEAVSRLYIKLVEKLKRPEKKPEVVKGEQVGKCKRCALPLNSPSAGTIQNGYCQECFAEKSV